MLDIDLLRGVTRPSIAALEETLLLESLKLVAVVVLSLGVSTAEEQSHGSNLVSSILLGLSLLDVGTEGSQASSETRHEDVGHLVLRDLHDGVRGVAHAVVPGPQEGEEAGAEPELRLARLRLPVLSHHQQLALSRTVRGGRANRVHSLLDGRDQLHVLVSRDLQGSELGQVVGVGVSLGLPVLELLCLPIQSQLCNLHFLDNVHSIWDELLEELSGWLAEKIQVLGQQLLHGGQNDDAFLLLRCHLLARDDLEGVQLHHFHELLHGILVVGGVNRQGLAICTIHQVFNAGTLNVNFDVEGGAVVVLRSQALPIGNAQQLSLVHIRTCQHLCLELIGKGQVFAQVANLGDDHVVGAGIELSPNVTDILFHCLCCKSLHLGHVCGTMTRGLGTLCTALAPTQELEGEQGCASHACHSDSLDPGAGLGFRVGHAAKKSQR
mmetsp:Transcript_3926/g.9231  ORF Transcript_3926/g.9231 Transcript_3926/m.9231 type:complete len:438 (+) Transcript_3926:379-1692(+)